MASTLGGQQADDREGVTDLLAARLESPHPLFAEFPPHAVDTLAEPISTRMFIFVYARTSRATKLVTGALTPRIRRGGPLAPHESISRTGTLARLAQTQISLADGSAHGGCGDECARSHGAR